VGEPRVSDEVQKSEGAVKTELQGAANVDPPKPEDTSMKSEHVDVALDKPDNSTNSAIDKQTETESVTESRTGSASASVSVSAPGSVPAPVSASAPTSDAGTPAAAKSAAASSKSVAATGDSVASAASESVSATPQPTAAAAAKPMPPAAAEPSPAAAKPTAAGAKPSPAAAKPTAAGAKPTATKPAAAAAKKPPAPPDPRVEAAKAEAERIKAVLVSELGEDVVEAAGAAHVKPMLLIKKEKWAAAVDLLRTHPDYLLDYVECMAGTDYPSYIEVVIYVQSTKKNHFICLKTRTNKENAEDLSVPSITHIYPGVNWEEREIFDLLGVRFADHPDLRRIMMPDDYTGHPLRKDFNPWD
jgi:NADH-quinone oxidoreductase subunit C